MATFKVGQRVRRRNVEVYEVPAGTQGTIIGVTGRESHPWQVAYDGLRTMPVATHVLEPLTDPGADAFLESIRKLGDKPYQEPTAPERKPARVEFHYSFPPPARPTYIDDDGIIRFGERPKCSR